MSSPVALGEIDLDALLAIVAAQRGLDFRDYRRAPIARGIASRLVATRSSDFHTYCIRAERDPREMDALVRSLVVPVTGFFRDSEVFEGLGSVVLPALARSNEGPLRVWCVGVATGEEAWSIAALLEGLRRRGTLADYEVLGSDIDEVSLEVARTARYAVGSVPFGHEGFEEVDGQAQPAGELRARVRFARHDLVGRSAAPREAVVASFHLILCRNVLLYFEPHLQERACARLLAALGIGSALLLGPVEDVPSVLHDRLAPFIGVHPMFRMWKRIR